ncbi:F-box/kelch-repeat protein At1g23390 [Phalaenopsis equestris]|uniref:F-box/kelch-repeat protein At1g23390 n=1 Tax=Phalaenopsis equestris TaxID=78828 RepID=UPI0009E5FEF4|nr:F-box/kelch-repeat protein At1g23390 [Phalaenopsis equestris]
MARESPLQGDLLESIFSHVPTIDLLSALHVSRTWRRAVLSSIHRRPNRPWFFIHFLRRRGHHRRRGLSAAYDPHSQCWYILPHVTPPPPITCPFLRIAVPFQPLAATWSLLPPPLLHRNDAVISLVNHTLIIAGGVCELGDRTCAVESLALDSASFEWENCEPMPESLRESAAATWLAVAASNNRLYVVERGDPGRLAWFDLALGRWSSLRRVRLSSNVLSISAIGMGPDALDGADRLIVVGLMDYGALGIWEVEPDKCGIREIGMLPPEAVARIAGEGGEGMPAVGFLSLGGFGFLYELEGRGEVFACEFGSGKWNWEGIGWPPVVEEDPTAMVVFGCAVPAVEDLIASYGKVEGRDLRCNR